MIPIFNRYLSLRAIIFFGVETCLLLLSVYLGYFVRFSGNIETIQKYHPLLRGILFTAVLQICLYYNNLYSLISITSRREYFARLGQSLGAGVILLSILYFGLPFVKLGRGIFFYAFLFSSVFVLTWRVFYSWLLSNLGAKEKVLILGTDSIAINLAKELSQRKAYGLDIVGFLDSLPDQVGLSLVNPRVIGTFDDLLPIVQREKINRIIVAITDRRGQLPLDDLLKCRMQGVEIHEGISFYEKIVGKIIVEDIRPSWLIFSEGFRKTEISLLIKRISDIIIASLGLLLTWPLMLLVAPMVKLTSRGPVFYRQERVGEGGKLFNLLKFRTMVEDAEERSGPVWASENDDRITTVGRFLRLSRLDELPQFFNVLGGSMSFVGPRPERKFFIDQLERIIPYYSERFTVKPGITGWAQINYPYGSSVEDALEKLKYDLYYIKNRTLLLDFMVLFETVKVVLFGKGSR